MKKEIFSFGNRFFLLAIMTIFIVSVSFADQYVSIEIVWEMATSEIKDHKLIALVYIEDAIERGIKHDVILRSLDFLINEHIKNPIITDGQITNDFPDIRIQAARCLGLLGTIEAYNLLSEILIYENNETVLQEARSLIDNIEINNPALKSNHRFSGVLNLQHE